MVDYISAVWRETLKVNDRLIRVGLVVVFAGAVALVTEPAMADLRISGSIGSNFTDNANREPEDSADEFEQVVGLGLQYTHESKRYTADLDYAMTHNRYLKDEFQNDTNFTGVGTINYHLLPTNFDWFASYQRDLFLDSSNVADTPSNRSSQSIFQTGPRYHYDITRATRFQLGATYTETRNGSAIDSDSKRASGDLTLLHQVNSLLNVSLGLNYVDILEFEGGEEYVQTNYTAGLVRRLKNGEIDITVGYSEVDRDLTEDVGDRFFNIGLEHRVFNNVVELRAINEVTDSTIGLSQRELIDAGFDNVETNFSLVDIVKRRRYEASISRNVVDRANVSVFAYLDEEDFVEQDQDEEDRGVSFSVNFLITPNVQTELTVGREYTDYISQPSFGENETTFYVWGLDVAHSPRMLSSYEIGFTERLNEERKQSEYEEIEVRLSLNYQFL